MPRNPLFRSNYWTGSRCFRSVGPTQLPVWSCSLSSREESIRGKAENRLGGPRAKAGPDGGEVHMPVMLEEVLRVFEPVRDGNIIDATFGAGGYSRGLLEGGARVFAIDRDRNVKAFAGGLKRLYPDRFEFCEGKFSSMEEMVRARDFMPVDGVVMDIGVSSMQLDQAERGFSFMHDGPLDMRMGDGARSAADLVNVLGERELHDIIFAYGEERRARTIARAIVERRKSRPLVTTGQLAELVEQVLGRKPGQKHPATRTFQALRIAVNRELDELVEGLFGAERVLREGGWLGVVTFHSLEDRIVKRFFAAQKRSAAVSRHLPGPENDGGAWERISRPKKAGAGEIKRNPRARSATLRFARRSAQKPRQTSFSGLGVPLSKVGGTHGGSRTPGGSRANADGGGRPVSKVRGAA